MEYLKEVQEQIKEYCRTGFVTNDYINSKYQRDTEFKGDYYDWLIREEKRLLEKQK